MVKFLGVVRPFDLRIRRILAIVSDLVIDADAIVVVRNTFRCDPIAETQRSAPAGRLSRALERARNG